MNQEQMTQSYLKPLFVIMGFLFLGIYFARFTKNAAALKFEYDQHPDDLIDTEILQTLDTYQGKQQLGIYQSAGPQFFSSPVSSETRSLLSNTITEILNKDQSIRHLLKRRTIINPLYLAYMRANSKRIFDNHSNSSKQVIVYPASLVDVVTPILLLAKSSAKEAIIYMLDINDEVVRSLQQVQAAFQDKSLSHRIHPKILERFYRQGMLLSEHCSNNQDQKTSPDLILALLLQELGVKGIDIEANELKFSLSNKHYTFKFITADITDKKSLEVMTRVGDTHYIYITKAAAELDYPQILPIVFSQLGFPSYCFLSRERLNPQFARTMNYWVANRTSPTRAEVLKQQFIPNNLIEGLQEVTHPTLRRLHSLIIDSAKFDFGKEVTDYHLGTLHKLSS